MPPTRRELKAQLENTNTEQIVISSSTILALLQSKLDQAGSRSIIWYTREYSYHKDDQFDLENSFYSEATELNQLIKVLTGSLEREFKHFKLQGEVIEYRDGDYKNGYIHYYTFSSVNMATQVYNYLASLY